MIGARSFRLLTALLLLSAPMAQTPASAQAGGGGTLVIGMSTLLRVPSNALAAGSAPTYGSQLFASPLRFDKDWSPQPYLAETWTFQDDGRSLLLKLVKGATFHDGKPITSEDVAWSIMTIKANHAFNTMLEPVERVDTPSPDIAIIRLSRPYPALLYALSPALCPIMPKHVYDDGQPFRTHPRHVNPVGSGPFRMVQFDPREGMVLERNPTFFLKDRPKLDRVIFRLIQDPASQALALQRGEIDLLNGPLSVSQASQLSKAASVRIVRQGGEAIGPVGWLEFNLRRKPYDDVRVRRAISHAIDREFIVKQLHQGTTTIATGPLVPGNPFYTDKVDTYRLDLDRANRLLDEAGLKRDANGTRFAMTIDYQPAFPDNYQTLAEYLRPQLKKIGIDVTVRVSPDFPTWAQRVSNWQHDATISGAFMWGDPAIGVHRTWVSSNIRKGVIFSNTQGYTNARVDELLALAGTERDVEQRKRQYHEVQRILASELPVAFIHEWSRSYALKSELTDYPVGIWGTAAPLDQIGRRR